MTDGREEELGTAGGGETCCGLLTDEREEGQGVKKFAVAW